MHEVEGGSTVGAQTGLPLLLEGILLSATHMSVFSGRQPEMINSVTVEQQRDIFVVFWV